MKANGGQAFPGYEQNPGADYGYYRPVPGITMRDYFAAKAMQGLMVRSWGDVQADELFKIWSTSAYGLADAMLKARER